MTHHVEQACRLTHRRDPDRPRRALDGVLVCAGHRTGLARTLLELPDMYRRLAERHVASGRGLGEHRPSGNHGLALSDPVSALRGNLYTELATWARTVHEERGFTLPADEGYAIARFVAGTTDRRKLTNLDWWCAHPAVDEFHDTVEHLSREAFRLLYPSGRRRFEVGACIEVTSCDTRTRAEQRCPGRMLATLTDTDDALMSNLYCEECGVEITADGWITYGRRVVKLQHQTA